MSRNLIIQDPTKMTPLPHKNPLLKRKTLPKRNQIKTNVKICDKTFTENKTAKEKL